MIYIQLLQKHIYQIQQVINHLLLPLVVGDLG